MKSKKNEIITSKVSTDLLLKIAELSKALLQGDYLQRIVIDYSENPLSQIITHLNALADSLFLNPPAKNGNNEMNIEHFINAISSLANHDFTNKLPVSNNATILDAIAIGINILGDELEHTTISRNYFSNIYNAVSEIIIITDVDGKITDVNSATEKLLHKSKKELLTFNVVDLLLQQNNLLEAEIAKKEETYTSFFDKKLNTFNNHVFETILLDETGNGIPFSFTIAKITDNRKIHNGFLFIFRNITERKYKEINDLKLMISEQEKERNRLANDLHDSLGQELNAINMYLNSLAIMDKNSPNFSKTLEVCKALSDKSIESIREISFDIMPRSLREGGLIYALQGMVSKLNTIFNIQCFITDRAINIDLESQILIFRIIQEFINNSLKHNKGGQISLSLKIKRKIIYVSLLDKGFGFNMDEVKKGNGIHNIIMRLKLLKAEYQFNSELGIGTELNFSIPNFK